MLQFDTYYHIYNHANGDDNLFREMKNYDFFLKKYQQHINPIAETIAWCLMPNHFHLLVKIKSENEIVDYYSTLEKLADIKEAKQQFLSKQFSNFFSSYSLAFNKEYNRKGSLFLKNFKCKEILDESYLINLIFYIHLNPVKYGFVQVFTDWNYSSYHTFPDVQAKLMTNLFDGLENFQKSHFLKNEYFKEYQEIEDDLK